MKHALIVDDSRIVRKVSRKILESFGYQATEAENGQQALDQFSADCELIMLDWHMPVMDGMDFLKHLRARHDGKNATVIFCTTETDMSHIQAAMVAGANEYVMKPFDEGIIRSKLQQLGLM